MIPKFRALVNGKMHYPQSVTISGDILTFQPDDMGGGTFFTSCFQLSTDFKDKNGKELFNGEVVDVCQLEGQIIPTERCFVDWNEKKLEWCLRNVYADCFGERDCLFSLGEFVGCENLIESIGNIHENPELLK